jgi:hypothetical protein
MGYGFLSGFLYRNVRGCVSLKKQTSRGKVVEVTANNKEENSSDFCLDFVQEFALVSYFFFNNVHIKDQSFKQKKFILYFIAPSLGQRDKILQAFYSRNMMKPYRNKFTAVLPWG